MLPFNVTFQIELVDILYYLDEVDTLDDVEIDEDVETELEVETLINGKIDDYQYNIYYFNDL